MLKIIPFAVVAFVSLRATAQQVYLRPSAGLVHHFNSLKNTEDFIRPKMKRGVDMALFLEYRNKKNIGYTVGVGEGLSWSGFYVAEKITGSKSKGIYSRNWAPPFTRMYAGIEFPVGLLLNKEKYLAQLNEGRRKGQFFIGGGLALNFYDGGPRDDFNPSGYVVPGKDNYFKGGSVRDLPASSRTPSAWLRLRYQHYTKKGKEGWSILGMAHYAPFRPLYKDEIYFETKEGNHTALNVNRGLQFSVSFSYPIRLWSKKNR